MKLHLSSPAGRNAFTGYGDGYVAVNGVNYRKNLLVLPDLLVEDWPVSRFEDLAETHFAALLEWTPAIVLLGTGRNQRFPRPRLHRVLLEARVGLEVMDTPAACRTFNILAAEDRKVAAALLLD